MKRERKPPQSLYKTSIGPTQRLENPTKQQLFEFLKAASPVTAVANALETIRQTAMSARTDATIEKGREWADKIDRRLISLDTARKNGCIDLAVFEALKLAEEWMMLRTDAVFAKAVRAREKQLINLPNKAMVTDADIHEALKTNNTQAEAAAALGIDPRQIRNRIPADKRRMIRTSKQKRKSERLP